MSISSLALLSWDGIPDNPLVSQWSPLRQHLPVSPLLSVSLIQVVPVPIPSASLMHAEGPGTPQVLCLSNKVETTKCGCQAALYVELWGRVWWVHMGRGWMKRGTLQSNLGAACATDPLCTHSKLQCTLHLPTGQHLTMNPHYTLQQPSIRILVLSPPHKKKRKYKHGGTAAPVVAVILGVLPVRHVHTWCLWRPWALGLHIKPGSSASALNYLSHLCRPSP